MWTSMSHRRSFPVWKQTISALTFSSDEQKQEQLNRRPWKLVLKDLVVQSFSNYLGEFSKDHFLWFRILFSKCKILFFLPLSIWPLDLRFSFKFMWTWTYFIDYTTKVLAELDFLITTFKLSGVFIFILNMVRLQDFLVEALFL